MTPEAWMICHHPVYHGDDDSVIVKVRKPWHKWNYRPNRVRISSNFTTIPATQPTFQQPCPRQREKIRKTNRCMPLYPIFHSIFRQLISPFLASFPYMWSTSYSLFFSHQQGNRPPWFHIPMSDSLSNPSRVCSAFEELKLSVTIRYLPGRRALIWIKATKIADVISSISF
jgi:hypothetical protein